jgi:WD40 repeat protein
MRESFNPYKGLASFDDSELDALFFFGREREREIIAANLMAARLTVLYGDTGVGKSSILRAGVVRHLRGLPDPGGVVVFDEWQDDPAGALRREVAAVTGLAPTDGLADTLEACATIVGGEILVILDGFEEYFLYHGSEGGAGTFLEDFSDAVTRTGLRAAFLVAIREDALAKIDRFKGRIPNLFGNYLRLDHLDRTAGREAIRGPVDRYNQLNGAQTFAIEALLVDAVLDQVAAGKVDLSRKGRGAAENGRTGERIEAPFLQLVMARLWEAETQTGSHVLRLETLASLGGAEQIVRDHLEGALAALDADQQDTAAAVFNHLVTPSGAKIAHDASDLGGYLGTGSSRLEPVLALLAAQRILRPVPGMAGSDQPRYEIYHDILADPVLAWRSRHESEREVERVQEAAARRHRRLLAIAVAAVLLAGAMAGVTIFAFSQRSEAQKQADRAKQETQVANGNAEKFRRAEGRANRNASRAKKNAERAAKNAQRAKRNERRANRNAAQASRNAERAKKAEANAKANLVLAQAETKRANAAATAASNANNKTTESLKNEQVAERNATASAHVAREANSKAQAEKKQADQNANQATAQALAATALTELNTAPEQALSDALKSAQLNPSGAESVLRSALLASRVQAILPVNGAASTAAVSPGSSESRTRSFRTTTVSENRSVLAVGDSSGLRLYDVLSGKLIRTLKVGAKVAAIAFSPDGRLVATASPNGYVTVWEVASGRAVHRLSHAGHPVRSVAFSHDGRLLATGSNNRRAEIWNVATWQLAVPPVPHPHAVSLVAFSPDDRLLLTVDGANARLIDVATGQIVNVLAQRDGIRTATFSPDGAFVATGGTGIHATGQLWSVPDGRAVGKVLAGHGGDIVSESFSPEGKLLVTASEDDTARVWSVPDGDLVTNLVAHRNPVRTAVFSPDSRWIVTASRDGTARVWDLGGSSRFLLAGDRGPLSAAFFTRDGRSVVTTSDDGSARLWDPGTTPELKRLGIHSAACAKPPNRPPSCPQPSAVNTVSVSPDGRFALSAGDDGTVRVWPLGGGRARTLQLGGRVTTASWSHDGKSILAASDNGTARVWRASDGRVVSTLLHGAPIRAAAFSPDDERVVTAGDDGIARLWKTVGGARLHELHHGGAVNAVFFSPDGRLVATGGADGLGRIWRVRDGGSVRTLEGHNAAIVDLAFSPDGNWLATASKDHTARIWSVQGAGSKVLPHGDAVTSLAFSPDGKLLVTASRDHDAIVWNVPDGQRLRTLSGHFGVVSDVAFSPDGRWIVTAGPSSAGLWQASDASLLLFLHGSGAQLTTVAFSPRGWRVVTGSKDGTVATYDCQLCGGVPQLVRLAKARLSDLERNLTEKQRGKYLGVKRAGS